jgi:hypothetical protein
MGAFVELFAHRQHDLPVSALCGKFLAHLGLQVLQGLNLCVLSGALMHDFYVGLWLDKYLRSTVLDEVVILPVQLHLLTLHQLQRLDEGSYGVVQGKRLLQNAMSHRAWVHV